MTLEGRTYLPTGLNVGFCPEAAMPIFICMCVQKLTCVWESDLQLGSDFFDLQLGSDQIIITTGAEL